MENAQIMPTNAATIPAMTTVLAEQGTRVMRNAAIVCSRRVFKILRLIIAGTAQPNPMTMGIIASP